MPLEDLELEFEDEDESKKKKNDAIHVDVDLEFSTEEAAKPRQAPARRPTPVGASSVPAHAVPRPAGQATNPRMQIPQKAAPQQQPAAKVTQLPVRPASQAPTPQSAGSSALKVQGSVGLADQVFTDDVNEEVVELREKVQKIEIESQIKVGVAEFKAEFMSDVLSDMKLLDHQVTQILSKINAKHPDSKNEVMMIKKLLTEFASKKRK